MATVSFGLAVTAGAAAIAAGSESEVDSDVEAGCSSSSKVLYCLLLEDELGG